MIELVLAIDLGTSSIRCSAFTVLKPSLSAEENPTNYVQFMPGSLSSRTISCIEPISGKINIYTRTNDSFVHHVSLFDVIDTCVDETLSFLRNQPAYSSFRIIGLGFSSFVMNLVGVSTSGEIIDPLATISYACNSSLVHDECKHIQR